MPQPENSRPPPQAGTQPSAPAPSAVRCIDSLALLGGAAELRIDHRGTQYRLRQTALGKLILTK